MERFLDNIEKYKIAILGTILLHVLAFLVFAFSTVKEVALIPNIEVPVSIPVEDIEFEPEMAEILELNKEKMPDSHTSNLISDENDSRDKSFEDYSPNEEEISEASMMSAKELEAKYFEEAAANNDRSDIAENMELHELKNNINQNNSNA